jgi:hypothetical protein
MAYEQEIKLLEDEGAQIESWSSVPQRLEVTVKRRWERVDDRMRAQCNAFLDKFVSTLNTAAIAADEQAYYVDNPYGDKKVLPGRWRAVKDEAGPAVQRTRYDFLPGVSQTLARSYVMALEKTGGNVDGSKFDGIARMASQEQAHGNSVSVTGIAASKAHEHTLLVEIPFVSPQHEQSIVHDLQSTNNYSGIVVEGQTYAGPYKLISVGTKKSLEDGSVSLILSLAETGYVLQGYNNYGMLETMDVLHVFDWPKDSAQEVIDAWKAAHPIGATAQVDYSRDASLVTLTLYVRDNKKRSWTWSYTSRYGLVTVHVGKNFTREEFDLYLTGLGLTNSTVNDVNLQENDSLLYDFTITSSEYEASLGEGFGAYWTEIRYYASVEGSSGLYRYVIERRCRNTSFSTVVEYLSFASSASDVSIVPVRASGVRGWEGSSRVMGASVVPISSIEAPVVRGDWGDPNETV